VKKFKYRINEIISRVIYFVINEYKIKILSINAAFVASCNTTKVRAVDVLVPHPSTNINAKRISITRIYFAFFWGGIEMTD
jgi:hypothetical protein